MSDQKSNPGSLVEALTVIGGKLSGAVKGQSSSVAKISSELSVNPICFIDARLNHLPETYDIVSGALTFFGGCYISSALLLSNKRLTNAMATIDRLNTNRQVKWNDISNSVKSAGNLISSVSNESHDYKINLFSQEEMKAIKEFVSTEANDYSDAEKKIEESQPLSIGKRIYINVEGDTYQTANEKLGDYKGTTVKDKEEYEKNKFVDKKDTYQLPINIRFSSYVLSSSMMADFMALLGMDKRLSSALNSWRNGIINLGELITMNHIVTAKKKLLMLDVDGRIREVMNRKTGNFAASVLTDNVSLGTVANTVIISDKTRKEAEYRLGYRFSNPNARDGFMNSTSTMILVIVDEESEMATMYIHGRSAGSELPLSEFKKASKKDSNNITDIIRAFSGGNTPGF